MGHIAGPTAFITGATHGIDLAIAEPRVAQNASVARVDLDRERLNTEIKRPGALTEMQGSEPVALRSGHVAAPMEPGS